MNIISNYFRQQQYKYIFGASTALMINMGLIVGFNSGPSAKINIISSILVIAVADNLTDSLGIHIYQESQNVVSRKVWLSTLANFVTRFLVSLIFILIILFLPLPTAVVCSLVFGLILLSIISFTIAKQRKTSPVVAIIEHIVIALLVIFLSHYMGKWIITVLK
jgi:vacuolar iron transporter family protein